MIDNIDKVLDRGEKINLLVDKTQDLTDTALDFRIKSKKLKRTMWWRNVKLLFILIFIILVRIFYLIKIYNQLGRCWCNYMVDLWIPNFP